MKWFRNRFRFAFSGLLFCAQDPSIRLQAIFGLMVLAAGVFFGLSGGEWLWILLSITLVIVSEIFNSCIEKCVDYISTDITEPARRIKDMAAAAVLCASFFAAACGLVIFWPHVSALFAA